MCVNPAKHAIWAVNCIFSQLHHCDREIPQELFLGLDLLFLLGSTSLVLCNVPVMSWHYLWPISCRIMFLFAADISHLQSNNYIFSYPTFKVLISSDGLFPFLFFGTIAIGRQQRIYTDLQQSMFSKHIEKINLLFTSPKEEHSSLRESLTLQGSRTSRRKMQFRISTSTPKPKYPSEISLIKEDLPKKYAKILEQLFKTKCSSLAIDFNQTNWEIFIKAFLLKNKFNEGQMSNETLNLNGFYLTEPCISQINLFLKQNKSINIVKLTKNTINPNNLSRLQAIKQLYLGNCRLGNDYLQLLFTKLRNSCIEKLSLTSSQIKNRNKLTKYQALISLINNSRTLHTLELGNMDIQPDSLIIQSCKNTSVKHLDLSDNTNVKGICSTLLSLNLTRNSIVVPFSFPMLSNELLILNLSYNKIRHEQFKQFLKLSYFANLKQLIVDHVRLDSDLLCFQLFLEQTPTLVHLSMVGCDLSQSSFYSTYHGVKHNRSLESLNLSQNRILNEKVADYISHMLQGCTLKEIKLRHCDIKDNLGHIIFHNIKRNKTIEKIDARNNLLGDRTAKTICNELKYAKNLLFLNVQQNIIKYTDIQEINSYLQSNIFNNTHQLDKQYQKLLHTKNQMIQANIIINNQAQKISKLEKQTDQLHLAYLKKFKAENQTRKNKLRNDIYSLRDSENQLMTDITLMQALPTLSELNSMQSRRQSFICNHQSLNNL